MTRAITPWCAPNIKRWYPEGRHCANPPAGAVLLVNHGTDLAWAIEHGQRAAAALWRSDLEGYTWLDHTAIIRPGGIVSEMGPTGHELRPLKDYQDRAYCVVEFMVPAAQQQLVLDSDERLHGITYGFIQYPALIVNGLTAAKVSLTWGDAMICSTAVAWCAKNVYFTLDRQDTDAMPADVAKAIGARWNG